MNNSKIIKSTTDKLTAQPSTGKVAVLAQMDQLTQQSTSTIRRDMAESVKNDVRVLKKFGLFTNN